MKFGEVIKGIFGKKQNNPELSDEEIRKKLEVTERDIRNIRAFQNASDSTGTTRAADAQRMQYLEERRAELATKLTPNQPAPNETQAAPVSTGSVTAPSAAPASTPPAGEGKKAA